MPAPTIRGAIFGELPGSNVQKRDSRDQFHHNVIRGVYHNVISGMSTSNTLTHNTLRSIFMLEIDVQPCSQRNGSRRFVTLRAQRRVEFAFSDI